MKTLCINLVTLSAEKSSVIVAISIDYFKTGTAEQIKSLHLEACIPALIEQIEKGRTMLMSSVGFTSYYTDSHDVIEDYYKCFNKISPWCDGNDFILKKGQCKTELPDYGGYVQCRENSEIFDRIDAFLANEL